MKQESAPPKERTREEILAEAQRIDEEIGPSKELVSIRAAFDLAGPLADRLGVSSYKTQDGLARALRKEKLVTDSLPRLVVGATTEEWIKSDAPGRLVQSEELTSERALRELFKRRAARRRKLDRNRKKPKPAQAEFCKKLMRNRNIPKAEDSNPKAESGSQKRKAPTKKRNPKKQSHWLSKKTPYRPALMQDRYENRCSRRREARHRARKRWPGYSPYSCAQTPSFPQNDSSVD